MMPSLKDEASAASADKTTAAGRDDNNNEINLTAEPSSSSSATSEQSPKHDNKRPPAPITIVDNNEQCKRQKQSTISALLTNKDATPKSKSAGVAKKGGDVDTLTLKIKLSKELSINDEKEGVRVLRRTTNEVLTVDGDDTEDDEEDE